MDTWIVSLWCGVSLRMGFGGQNAPTSLVVIEKPLGKIRQIFWGKGYSLL